MSIINKNLAYAKEIGDVGIAVRELVKSIKEKQSLGVIMGTNLPTLITAVEGADKMDDETRENAQAAYATMGYHSGESVAILLAKPVAPAPEPEAA